MRRDEGDFRPEVPGGRPSPAQPGGFPFPPAEGQGHAVRFYGGGQALIEAAADFAARGAGAGDGVLVLASPPLAAALPGSLRARGVEGGILVHDSGTFLAAGVPSVGPPDECRFHQAIAPLAARASAGRRGLRIFADFWEPLRDRDPETLLHIESLWTRLSGTLAFSLVCAYPLRGFLGAAPRFGRLCAAHDSVIPEESFRADLPASEGMRQIAEMQLRLAEKESAPERRGPAPDASLHAPGPEARLEAALRREAALAESERRFRALADSVPVLIWACAPDGKRVYVNRPWLEFTGNTLEGELGRGLEGIHPEDRDAVAAAFKRAMETRAAYRDEFRYLRRDGAWRRLLNTGSPWLGPDGSFHGFIGLCVDITERREAEELARRERSLEAVGRLAAGLAHDFNNLLTAINGYSEIGLSLAPEPGLLRDSLAEIQSAGMRAAALTRQLLAYGRKQPMAPVVFDLEAALDELEPMLRRMLGGEIRLERVRQKGLGRIEADPGQVREILMSLALNAREAMPHGGTLTLETADGMPGPGPDRQSRPHVILSVRDTGPGMTDPIRERIFDPFFTTKGAGPGSAPHAGLGLSSSYGAVRQSGGFVSVGSEPGSGSVFRLHFPWIEPEPGITPSSDPAGKPVAMAAAADDGVRRYLAHVLADEGFHAITVSGGEEALARAREAPRIDLLIAEAPLPGAPAAELAGRLRESHPASRTLILAASLESAGLPAPEVPGIRFLPRPFLRAELAAHFH